MIKARKRQSLVGEVVSDKMDKTVVVKVTRQVKHPIYKKYIKRFKKHKAHAGSVTPKMGDMVKITSTRPLSKTIRWQVSEIIRESVLINE
ncbi:MAG: 30S ribosomal protein S17 [Candidatus Marinimicrobia bacterium]|jgi:small subunit ribosomal protein S17|nr:30S ribosomal protein S17 [Candidatus Neomarinimicrobiota bacterium]MBT3617225.1 30S ribosomal protein S17 [Candidatus Neomarinimicrobiota bacterium]MBT3829738.1 30S ribosomal protein S17 [Candidatus Neomarinimicrobiota bacterium]MBT3997915.1 30S ribosomal protein S17 [Candidatus Neomarinimicrobiota bacterium]MBT4281293.1 30S ribosomal protein S17 [Candidatus Neomarinimicrobiota bacterium]